jgi:TRAP-type C4-dicarboxylate transport system substrate-binding protein
MKRFVLKAALALVAVSAFTLSQAQERTIKLSTANPKGHPITQGAEKFAELVAAKSGGKLKVNVFAGGTLGSDMAVASAHAGRHDRHEHRQLGHFGRTSTSVCHLRFPFHV